MNIKKRVSIALAVFSMFSIASVASAALNTWGGQECDGSSCCRTYVLDDLAWGQYEVNGDYSSNSTYKVKVRRKCSSGAAWSEGPWSVDGNCNSPGVYCERSTNNCTGGASVYTAQCMLSLQ